MFALEGRRRGTVRSRGWREEAGGAEPVGYSAGEGFYATK